MSSMVKTEVLHLLNGEVKDSSLVLCNTIDHGDAHGLPFDVEYHFAIDKDRTLVIQVSESAFSEMRRVAQELRVRAHFDEVKRIEQEGKRKFLVPKRKPRVGRRGRRRGRASKKKDLPTVEQVLDHIISLSSGKKKREQ